MSKAEGLRKQIGIQCEKRLQLQKNPTTKPEELRAIQHEIGKLRADFAEAVREEVPPCTPPRMEYNCHYADGNFENL